MLLSFRKWNREIKPSSASACFEKNMGNKLAYIKGNHLGVLSLGYHDLYFNGNFAPEMVYSQLASMVDGQIGSM